MNSGASDALEVGRWDGRGCIVGWVGMCSPKVARSLLIGTGIYDIATEGNVPKAYGHSIYDVLSDVN